MVAGIRRRALVPFFGLALLFPVAACGPGSSSKSGTGPEKSTVNVGYLPAPDFAALFVAKQKGFFRQAGLTVKTQLETGGAAAVPKLAGGSLDFSVNNYVSAIQATARGVGPEKVVADAYGAAPGTVGIIVAGDSPIRRPQDLAGKKVAVNTKGNFAQLEVAAGLKQYGVTIPESDFAEVPYPQMELALKDGSVDAALAIEPFITATGKSLGARMVLDSGAENGPAPDLPISGYVTTRKFAKENPRTVAAFRQAIEKAQRLVAGDRKLVESILPTYTKISAAMASSIRLARYPTSVSRARLQRVADLMLQYGYLKSRFDAGSLL
ncbi:ABC transporter substrate-binding protein [Actinomadura darangshiensis]|nr:ABC transporter substrate-binding protein [Actinomadura darangshiensis]